MGGGGGEFTVRQLQEAAVLDFWAVECTTYIDFLKAQEFVRIRRSL